MASYHLQIFTLLCILLACLKIFLSFRVIKQRRKVKMRVGGEQHPALMQAIRAHANLCEYSPLFLFMLFLLVYIKDYLVILLPAAAIFFMGRLIHAYGLSVMENREKPSLRGRILGMQLTLFAYIIVIIRLVALIAFQWVPFF